jgi:hypothetical protein
MPVHARVVRQLKDLAEDSGRLLCLKALLESVYDEAGGERREPAEYIQCNEQHSDDYLCCG